MQEKQQKEKLSAIFLETEKTRARYYMKEQSENKKTPKNFLKIAKTKI